MSKEDSVHSRHRISGLGRKKKKKREDSTEAMLKRKKGGVGRWAVVRTSLGNVEQTVTPSLNLCASTHLTSSRAISALCAPSHLFCTPTLLPGPSFSCPPFRKMGPMISGSCLWPSPDFCHRCPSLRCRSCSPPSRFCGFLLSVYPSCPLSLRLCVLPLSITCKVNAICLPLLSTWFTSYPFLLAFVYMAYIGCKYNNNMLTWSSFFTLFSYYLECYLRFFWFIAYLTGKMISESIKWCYNFPNIFFFQVWELIVFLSISAVVISILVYFFLMKAFNEKHTVRARGFIGTNVKIFLCSHSDMLPSVRNSCFPKYLMHVSHYTGGLCKCIYFKFKLCFPCRVSNLSLHM